MVAWRYEIEKYFTRSRFQHSKRNFVSLKGDGIPAICKSLV